MKKIVFVAALFFLFFFNGCSWLEHFIICNPTDMDVIVEYELDTIKTGIPIFDNHPTGYKTNTSGEIKWDESSEIKDEDTSAQIVRVILSPRTAIVFGTLYNDHFKSYKQEFINGRRFNLKRMLIQKGEFSRYINPENFDESVTKKCGMVYIRTR